MSMIIFSFSMAAFFSIMAVYEIYFGIDVKKGTTEKTLRLLKGETQLRKLQKKKTSSKSKQTHLLNNPIVMLIVLSLVSFIMLKNIWLSLLVGILGYFYPKYVERERKQKRKHEMNIQFKDAMQSVSNSLKAGNSFQTSLERCLEDLKRIYRHQKNNALLEEWEKIVSDLQLGQPIDKVLNDFKNRVKLEDVDTFVNSAVIIHEKGGNMTEVLANVTEVIGDRIDVKRDIMTLTAGKRSEAKLLTFMPLILLGLLMLFSPKYLDPMYDKPLGKLLATLGVIMLIANFFIGKKIINIDI
ncbi:type II secretion system F family protein [Fusibacter sp. 3D3]|uniref:type II secretion system F family protein n=1 Tax=Fusibacter sp. 3D3 TaxID=1048380 RepID=UPI000853D5AB|nr:type II secretion system F family protein [Fusibacter sp. 3D3]GAU76348.1 Flp pilus assembly protein TadB [Fusibacter sp. 3D3]